MSKSNIISEELYHTVMMKLRDREHISYLASAYTSPDKYVEKTNYMAAMEATAWLLSNQNWVFSPIVHCHPLAHEFKFPTSAAFWTRYDHAMLKICHELLILKRNWSTSEGVLGEIAKAKELKLPITFLVKVGPFQFERRPFDDNNTE